MVLVLIVVAQWISRPSLASNLPGSCVYTAIDELTNGQTNTQQVNQIHLHVDLELYSKTKDTNKYNKLTEIITIGSQTWLVGDVELQLFNLLIISSTVERLHKPRKASCDIVSNILTQK
jgi:hypothetical protein